MPPHWGEIPRIVEGVSRVSRYVLRPDLAELGKGQPAWLTPGLELDGHRQYADAGWVVLLEPGGAGQVTVPASWVELVSG